MIYLIYIIVVVTSSFLKLIKNILILPLECLSTILPCIITVLLFKEDSLWLVYLFISLLGLFNWHMLIKQMKFNKI